LPTTFEPSEPRLNVPILAALTAIAALLVLVGSIGPWATVLDLKTMSGMDTSDGAITLVAGIVAGVFTLLRVARPDRRTALMAVAFVAFLVAALLGLIDWLDLRDMVGVTDLEQDPFFGEIADDIAVNVGWGLVMLTVSAIAGTFLALADACGLTQPRPAASLRTASPPEQPSQGGR
jgi:hypothetical protein